MDYNLIWFILIAVLFVGYIILDGFDLGVGMHMMSAKTDRERRIVMNSIGPVWDGNEVWLITAGGATFAAFPHVYATIFSGYYTAFMLFLLVLIIRGVSMEFRSKVESNSWRKAWDVLFMVSSFLIALLLGVAFANVAAGLPLDAEMEYHGGLIPLLNPYALVFAIMGVLGLRLHGNLWLLVKTEDELQANVRKQTMPDYYLFLVAFAGLLAYTFATQSHLFTNYKNYPVLWAIPAITILLTTILPVYLKKHADKAAFTIFSSVIAFTLLIFIAGMFPNFVVSNPNPELSLNAYNSASSEGTLSTMFIIACIGVPLVLAYQVIIYRIFRGKVKLEDSSY